MCKVRQLLVLLFFMVIPNIGLSQCAMCKAVVETGDISMAEGVNNGITYLMVFPYLLIGVLFFTIYRYRKRIKN